jgi:TorA maturation chaperone TorD
MSALATAPRPSVDEATLDLLFQLVAATYRAPGDALRADLDTGAFADAAAVVANDLGLTPPTFGRLSFATLQERHVALFVSSGDGVVAPPYTAFAVDDELLGATFQQLGATFARYGIEVAEGWRDLPDHVAAVAEGGALLVGAGRLDGAREVLERYLAPWFERYAAAIAAADVGGFYGTLTPFLNAAIKEVSREAAA